MKMNRILENLCTLAATLLIASCTQNELADKQGEPLPEGKYPLTFTATIDGAAVAATPQTRASVDGDATSLDYIGTAIIYNNTTDPARTMIFERDGTTSTWKYKENLFSTDPTLPYWGSDPDGIRMMAWYFPVNNKGEAYNDTDWSDAPYNVNTHWKVASNQNENNGYENSDFLCAYENFKFEYPKTLHFFHQTAKVVVHIIKGSQTPTDITKDKISMTIGDEKNKVYVKKQWTCPSIYRDNDAWTVFGTWVTDDSESSIIIPKEFEAKGVPLNDREKLLASYEALVIPQKIAAEKKLFVINIGGYDTFYYKAPAGGITWQSGTEHTYYITIKGSSLSVITKTSISWGTDGATGSGSVEIE